MTERDEAERIIDNLPKAFEDPKRLRSDNACELLERSDCEKLLCWMVLMPDVVPP